MSKQNLLEKEDNNKLQIVGMEKKIALLGNLSICLKVCHVFGERKKVCIIFYLFLKIARLLS